MKIKKLVPGALFIILLVCFQAEGAKNFSDNGDGTVTDNSISLIWQQGEGGTMTWEAALTYCENLGLAGLTDWRLPNTNELISLVDDSKIPSLDTAYFPGVSSSLYYWSSTTFPSSWSNTPTLTGISTAAWAVSFSVGNVDFPNKTGSNYVRCVRGGQ